MHTRSSPLGVRQQDSSPGLRVQRSQQNARAGATRRCILWGVLTLLCVVLGCAAPTQPRPAVERGREAATTTPQQTTATSRAHGDTKSKPAKVTVSLERAKAADSKLLGQPLIQYGARCYNLSTRVEQRRRAGQLSPIELRVRRVGVESSKSGHERPSTFIGAQHLARRLRKGTLRSAVLVGLGGVGKSTFAKVIEAAVCDVLPTVRVDLNVDVARHLPKRGHQLSGVERNPVLAAAARALKVAPSARRGTVSAAARALGGGPWLLLLDSLDEVADTRHDDVVRAVAEALKQSPNARVLLFTRPPVATPLAQLSTIHHVFELEPKTCAGAMKSLASWARRTPTLQTMPALIHRLGLDRRVQLGGRCAHPHLMTWRDLKLVKRLHQRRPKGHVQRWDKQFDGSRASLYRLFALDELAGSFQSTGRSPEQLLSMLDALTATPTAHGLDRALDFSQTECKAAAERRALTDTSAFCRRLLRSHLFATPHSDGHVGFANQSVADWLIARRLDARLGAVPAADRCAEVARQDKRFRSSEIAAFFVGMPHGRRCLATVLTSLCQTGAIELDLIRTLERGLPWGQARIDAVARARAAIKQRPNKHTQCAHSLLRGIAMPRP